LGHILLQRTPQPPSPARRWEKNHRKWRKPIGDMESGDFRVLQPTATVCEQSATDLASTSGVQQFVNKVQQIATMDTPKNGFQATQNA
jgi:hypothetical protein